MNNVSVDAAALRILRSQHGFATVAQLYEIGSSKDQIADRVRKRIMRRYGTASSASTSTSRSERWQPARGRISVSGLRVS